MKEKIRLLESQLVREKARTAHQVAGSPSLSHHSPAHSGLVYAGSVDSYPTGQVQPYAAAAAVAARVQVRIITSPRQRFTALSLSLSLSHSKCRCTQQ